MASRPARNPLHPISRSRSKPPYLFQPGPRPILLPSQALLTMYVVNRSSALVQSLPLATRKLANSQHLIAIYSPLLVRPTTRSLLLACSLE